MIPTIEATLPLHMIASEGHTQLLEMLIKYVYPEKYLHTYRSLVFRVVDVEMCLYLKCVINWFGLEFII